MNKLLIEFKPGEMVKIKDLSCGSLFESRLSDLGLYKGAEIKILKNDMIGPMIIKILNSKMALGRGEAKKIYAEKI